MRLLRGVSRFAYDFVIGDDWKNAAGVVSALLIGLMLLASGVPAAVTAPVTAGLGWYLLAVAVGFAVLELSPILAAVPGRVPAGGFAPGMPNPVYGLDLTLFLPLCVGTALLLWRDHPASAVLAAMVLAKKPAFRS